MQPPIHHGQVPHFAPIGEYYFERLCRDLLVKEPHIRASRLYGKRGQKQYGIDVRAEREDGGLDVGQCKCYAAIQPEDIRKASDDFLDHLPTWWARKGVRRFILFMACDVDRTELQEEIGIQSRRFHTLGVEYEAWSAEILRDKLAPHRELAKRHLPPAWVDEICGEDGSGANTVNRAVVAQAEELSLWATEWVKRELEEMRTAVREGRRDDAIEWTGGLRENRLRWYSIADDVRARVIRFEASVMAHTADGVARARELVEEALAGAPSLDTSIPRALITYHTEGAAAATEILAGHHEIDHLNLRAGLLLEQRRVDECLVVLDEASTIDPAHAEALRLRALCLLARGDPIAAFLAAERARALQPTWFATRYMPAILRYFSALSPVAVPKYLPAVPEPVDWFLVRVDDESLARLQDAANMFADLLAESAPDDEQRGRLDLWRLACLANSRERQREAAEACRALLSADPANYWAVTWAVARRWDVDLGPSRRRFTAMLADGSATILHVVALVRIDLADGRAADAADILDRAKALFINADAEDGWPALRVQVAARLDDVGTAMSLAEAASTDAHAHELRAVALNVAARVSGDAEPLWQHLRAHFQSPEQPEMLLQYCQYMDAHRQWAAVAEYAGWLADGVGTADAVRLAAIALFNAEMFEQCHRLIDDHQGCFPRGQLPIRLRHVRAFSLHASRRPLDALAEAEALARDDPSAESLLHLGQLYVETGNFPAVQGVVRQLGAVPSLTPSDMLQATAFAALNDDRMAIVLWRRAVAGGIPDEAVTTAYALGARLGLDAELGPLTARLWDLGSRGQGGVHLAKVDELVDAIRQHHERGAHLDQVYRSGSAPIHLIGAAASLPLADPFHARLLDNEAAPIHQEPFPLLVRHGGRAFPSEAPPDLREGQLHLDVTAILLAAHTSVLDVVERAYKPLRIPPDLIGALVWMREHVAHPQPKRLSSCEELLALTDQGLLKVVTVAWPQDVDPGLEAELGPQRLALFEAARQADGYVADFLPLQRPDLSGIEAHVPDNVRSRFVNCGAIVESLRQHGPLSASARAEALASLGTEGRVNLGAIVPPPGGTIFCHGVARLLAEVGLLRLACSRFDVRVAQAEIEDARAEVAAGRRIGETVAWLDELIGRVSLGVDHGVYQYLDAPVVARGEDPDNATDTDTRCLLNLLQFKVRPGDAIWVDDRNITGYLHRDGAPVVGVYEVLAALRARGDLQDAQYYQTLHRLRAANVLFLPVQPEELLYHLTEARVEEGRVVPTHELLTLRRYVARCFRQGQALQRSAPQLGPAGQFGEIVFLRSITRAVGTALIRVWGEADDGIARARAEWLFTNVFVEDAALAHLVGLPSNDANDRYRVAATLAHFLTVALTVAPDPRGASGEMRQRYLRWLWPRVVYPRLHADPELVPAVVEQVKDLLRTAHELLRGDSPVVADVVVQSVCEELPGIIGETVREDVGFLTGIGAGGRPMVVMSGVGFAADEFWPAVASAVNGSEVVLRALEPDADVTLRPHVQDSRPTFCFTHPAANIIPAFDPDLAGVLLESHQEREAAVQRLRPRLDRPSRTFAQDAGALLTVGPGERVETVKRWLGTSVTEHLRVLQERFTAIQRLSWTDLLPPAVEGLTRHFRLENDIDNGRPFRDALDAAARELADDEGLEEAFARLAGLPVPLPTAMLAQIAALPAESQRTLIGRLIAAAWSPLSRIHLVRLLYYLSGERRSYGRLARRVIRRLLSADGAAACDAFLGLAVRVNDELNHLPEVRTWLVSVRLAVAWGYAHRLFGTLVSSGARLDRLQATFASRGEAVPVDWFERQPAFWSDASHPRRSTPTAFLLAGVAYGLGDEGTSFLDDALRSLVADWLLVEIDDRTVRHWRCCGM